MNRLFTLALGLGLVAAMAVPVMAGGPEKAMGSGTFFNGSGKLAYFEFNAHEPTDRQPAKGSLFHAVKGEGWYVVDVDFVALGLYDACFSGEIVAAGGSFSGRVGNQRATVVHDGGEPGIGVDTFAGADNKSCFLTKTGYPITSGNIQVQGRD